MRLINQIDHLPLHPVKHYSDGKEGQDFCGLLPRKSFVLSLLKIMDKCDAVPICLRQMASYMSNTP